SGTVDFLARGRVRLPICGVRHGGEETQRMGLEAFSHHQMKHQIRKTLIAAAAICSLLAATVHACTGIRLIAEDGTVIHARTMEFAIDIHSDVIMVPRGYARTGTTPDGKEGLKWKAKYASVGANGVGLPVLF